MASSSCLGENLVYKLYQSGLSNERLSLEIAIGLAVSTGKDLVLYSKNTPNRDIAATYGGGYRLAEAGWYDHGRTWMPPYIATNVLDIYQTLPIKPLALGDLHDCTPELFDNLLSNEDIFPVQLTSYCASVPSLRVSSGLGSSDQGNIMCDQFMDGRPSISPPPKGAWILQGDNLGGFYSRFFYDPSGSAREAVQGMQLCGWITNFADQVSQRLGSFNGCHIRLTDMLRFLPQDGGYSEAISDVVASWMPSGECLLIASDESSRSEFFFSLRKQFSNIIFLDDYLKYECEDLWGDAPLINESILGLIIGLVMERSILFMGTPGSTFSGFIHRGWVQRRCMSRDAEKLVFRYIHNGLFGTGSSINGYFERGAYVESSQGLYSWNRIQVRSAMKGQLAWYREWPECIGMPCTGPVGGS